MSQAAFSRCLTGVRVLVVDDSKMVRDFMVHTLSEAGAEVDTHERGFGTGAVVVEKRPRVIFLDVEMPGLNGPKVAELLMKRQERGDFKIVLFSSLAEDMLMELTKNLGVHGYIQKQNLESIRDEVVQVACLMASDDCACSCPVSQLCQDSKR